MSNSLLFFPLIAFVTGQFVGLFCRSPIIAVFVALTIACAAQVWLILAGYLVESTWVWLAVTCSVFPAMILATWLRTPSWLIGSSRTRDWLRPLLIPVFVLVLQLVGFVAHRVSEVPNVAVATDWHWYAARVTPAALATAKQYDSLAAEIAADPENEALLDDVLRVASSPTCAIHDFSDPSNRGRVYDDSYDFHTTDNMARSITDYVLRLASGYRESGELSQAWKCYEGALSIASHLYQQGPTLDLIYGFQVEQRVQRELVQWALLPNQEADLLRLSRQRLRRLGDEQPPLKQTIELDYLMDQGSISRSQFARWMPWEGTRATRLNRVWTAQHLGSVNEMEDRLARRLATHSSPAQDFPDEKELLSLTSRTLIELESSYPVSMNGAYLWNELLRRGTICALDVARYRVEHGSLPPDIDQFNELPGYETVFDPTTGQPFEYRLSGMPVETRMWSQNNDAIVNAPGTPLLWSEAWDVTITQHATHDREWYGVGIPIGVASTSEPAR